LNLKAMVPIFSSVFVAELGDKTQLATLMFVSGGAADKWEVFLASSLALVFSTLIAVLAGDFLGRLTSPIVFKMLAGFGFLIMGSVFLFQGFKTLKG